LIRELTKYQSWPQRLRKKRARKTLNTGRLTHEKVSSTTSAVGGRVIKRLFAPIG
jgi:hypothetical protein